jgi:hypothetical protein
VGFIRIALNLFRTKFLSKSSHQYHNPLAVEPESAKDAARKITSPISRDAASADLTAQVEHKDFFK